MNKATVNMTPEQEEMLDSGLRMLAHMIAETHLRRIELRKKNETTTQSPKTNRRAKRKKLPKIAGDNLSEDHDE